ncbi:MAG TPA: rhomboid family intramembrane serine protease [Pirellulales bacterium]|jgi:membrane associated rhomboid family serine protease|nr:rhomboid family intramembrane serine protease [Pirellulales bacterium]
MVFPLSDDNSQVRTVPVINYAIIVLNVLVFVFLQGLGQNNNFTYAYACVPEEILTGRDITTDDRIVTEPITGEKYEAPGLRPTPIPVWFTILTSMFMHGGIAHIAGNMWFLWIFGDNIEDDLGHGRYLAFYLVCGIVAALAHVFASAGGPNEMVPTLGASGAISGVLGAYMVMHATQRVRVILFRILTDVPAYVAVGIWFAFQLISGLGMLGSNSQAGGVAYAAHVGGFVAGLVLIKPFMFGHIR